MCELQTKQEAIFTAQTVIPFQMLRPLADGKKKKVFLG